MDSTSVSRLSEPSRDKIRQLFGNRNLWYLFGIACGAVATAYFSQLLFKQLVKAGKNELVLLKQRITQERVKSKAIVNLDITETHNLQIEHPLTKIVFTFYFMDNLKLKPTRPEAQQKTHPFLPPFEPGIFITNLSETHNLLFNKFCVVKNHCLVVTRKFENQTNQLNRSDFAAAFKVMRALEGFCFYNSGPLSGASQAHKHFQVMPYDKDHRYDIIKLINKEASRLENPVSSFECSLFKFAHKIGVIPSFDNNQDYQQIGESLETIYESLLKSLKIDTKSMSYNLILTESWILIVKRGKEKAFDMLSVNSLGFLGTFLLKDREQLDFVLKKNPIEILEDITYPSNSITNL